MERKTFHPFGVEVDGVLHSSTLTLSKVLRVRNAMVMRSLRSWEGKLDPDYAKSMIHYTTFEAHPYPRAMAELKGDIILLLVIGWKNRAGCIDIMLRFLDEYLHLYPVQAMDSIEFSRAFHAGHADTTLRSIDYLRQVLPKDVFDENFSLSTYVSPSNNMHTKYVMTRKGTILLALAKMGNSVVRGLHAVLPTFRANPGRIHIEKHD